MTGDEALDMLLAGNRRYVANRVQGPDRNSARREEVARGQHPFAALLCCSDSRVPPEIIFDEGLGDLFSVRVAGNVATDDVIASLEYAVVHTGTKLIMVMGHEQCGAIEATLQGGAPEGHLAVLVDRIKTATDAVKDQPGDTVDLAVRQNVGNVVAQLRSMPPILAREVASGGLKIVGARYDLETGMVELLE